MKVTGKIMNSTARANICGRMVVHMRENTEKGKKLDLGSIS
jgi:hypothetical protein